MSEPRGGAPGGWLEPVSSTPVGRCTLPAEVAELGKLPPRRCALAAGHDGECSVYERPSTPVPSEREIRDQTLQVLRSALLQVDDRRAQLVAEGDLGGLAAGAQDLITLLDDLRAIERQVRVDLAHMIDGDKAYGVNRVTVEGVGVLESKGGWTRKNWRSEELLAEVIARAISTVEGERIVNDDGEVLDVAESETLAVLIHALIEVLPINASLTWRTGQEKPDGTITGLKAWDLDDADYCDRVDKPRLATIPKRK